VRRTFSSLVGESVLQAFGGEKLKERNHLEELGIDARIILQDRQCMCNATLWRVGVAIVPLYTQQCVLCVLLSYVSLSLSYSFCFI